VLKTIQSHVLAQKVRNLKLLGIMGSVMGVKSWGEEYEI
jgi:hypothetical protein